MNVCATMNQQNNALNLQLYYNVKKMVNRLPYAAPDWKILA